MGFINRHNFLHLLISVSIFVLISVSLFSFAALLINVLIVLIPAALVVWIGYKAFNKIKNLLTVKENKESIFTESAVLFSSEENIEKAILNNEFIDVDYSDV